MSDFDWHCVYCGNGLRPIRPEDGRWYEDTEKLKKAHGTEWFFCTNEDCTFADVPLVLCHPVYGWDRPAGDSFAIAYVK